MQVTTPDDMLVAEGFLMSKAVEKNVETHDVLERSAESSDLSEASVV